MNDLYLVQYFADLFPPDCKCRRKKHGQSEGKSVLSVRRKGGVGAVSKMIDLQRQEGFEITVFSPDGEEEGNASRQREMAKKYDLILYIGNLASRSNSDAVQIEWHEPMWADAPGYINVIPTVFVSLDYPYLLPDVPRIKTYINTYCSSSIAIQACVNKLLGRSAFIGKAPSDFFCGKWDTRL